MFRPASLKEIECLLISQDRKLPPTTADGKVYKEALSAAVRECMLTKASKFLITEMENAVQREVLKSGTGLTFSCDCSDSQCKPCHEVCTNFAEGVLAVLERDFVQMTHGKAADMLESRVGVKFLLAGITLGLLYESMPNRHGFDELVLQVLMVALDRRSWVRALELFGPAPPRVYQSRLQRVKTGPRYRSKNAMSVADSPEIVAKRSRSSAGPASRLFQVPINQRKVPSANAVPQDPHVCTECGIRFRNSDSMQECECGTVTMRYTELKFDACQYKGTTHLRPRSNTL